MTPSNSHSDTPHELVLTRTVDVSPTKLWQGWTTPELLKRWFAPAPWSVAECDIDLRPGGRFRTVMRSPEGEEFPGDGCILEVVENRKLVWTDALLPGYRPAPEPFFTAIITFEPDGSGTRYTARALHKDEAGRKAHEDMGFHEGWGKALDQLVLIAREL